MEQLNFEQQARLEALRTAQYTTPSIREDSGSVIDYNHKDPVKILENAQKFYDWLTKK